MWACISLVNKNKKQSPFFSLVKTQRGGQKGESAETIGGTGFEAYQWEPVKPHILTDWPRL
jgi:hypothetical protein